MLSDESEDFFLSSPQTMPSFKVFELARKIPRKNIAKTIDLILSIISAIKYRKPKFWIFIFLRRSGADIFELCGEKFCTGCADYAIAFMTLARACGIPCRIIHALRKDWLCSSKLHIQGHCFVECFDKKRNKWVLTDPTEGEILPALPNEYVFHAKGRDLWHINLKSYLHMFTNVTKFRRQWKKQNLQK